MRHLVIDHWKHFVQDDGTFDGHRFEPLVERLLNVHFGGSWRMTKYSWDGAKDAVRTEQRVGGDGAPVVSRWWAEAKLYHRPIALHVISKTLVMAVIEHPERLLLFSYSPIVANARNDLSRFSAATGIQVQVIDDEALENIILRNLNEVRTPFFAGLPDDFSFGFNDGALALSSRLTQDVDIDPLRLGGREDIRNGELPTVNLRALLRLQLTIWNNRTARNADVTVTLQGIDENGAFEVLNKDTATTNASIVPHGLGLFEFYLRPNVATTDLRLPTVTVSEDGEPPLLHDPGTIAVRKLLEPPLIGARFHEFIASFRERVSLRAKPVFATISGRSGVGKTRLTTELAAVLLAKGKEIHLFDGAGQKGGFADFVRKLCARLYRLPDFEHVVPLRTAVPPAMDAGPTDVTVDDILYDPSIDPAAHMDAVLRFTERAIDTRAVALLVDNVQYLDRMTIEFIDRLVQRYRDTASQLVCVFAFNTDMLGLNGHAVTFADKLSEARLADPRCNLAMTVEDLCVDEVGLFFDHMISAGPGNDAGSFTHRHHLVVDLLRSKILPRPLNVVQTMAYLADVGALRRRDDALVVDDVRLLHRTANEMPTDLKKVIQLRWRLIVQARPELDDAGHVLAIARAVHFGDADLIGLGRDHRERLIEHGIAKENTIGELSFYHEQVERSIVELYEHGEAAFAARVARDLKNAHLDEVYFPAYVVASARGGIDDDSLVRRGVAYMERHESWNDLAIAFGESLRALIRKHPAALSPPEELRALADVCALVSVRNSAYRQAVFGEEVTRSKARMNRYRAAPEELISLIREYASHKFAVQDDAGALEILEDASHLVDELEFATPRDKEISRAGVLNRLCVAYKSLARKSDALTAGNASLELATRYGELRLIAMNHVDLGYVYYDSVPFGRDLKAHWETAAGLFDLHESTVAAVARQGPSVNLVRAKLLTLDRRFDEADAVIEECGERYMREYNAFFGIGFIVLKIVRLLLSGDAPRRPALVRDLADQAVDACIAHNVARRYWKALHARAQVQYVTGDSNAALQSYEDALKQLLAVTNSANEPLFRYFFEDMAITSRRLASPLSDERIASIRNAQLRDDVRTVCRYGDREFTDYLEHYQPCSTFNDGKTNLPCP